MGIEAGGSVNTLSRDEFDRMWRVVDQSLSGHSILRDRYRRRQVGLTLLVMGLSIAATALAFLSGEAPIAIHGLQISLAVGAGFLTTIIFFLALADLILRWQRQAWAHEDAVRRLADLKAKMRAMTTVGSSVDTSSVDLRATYEQTMAGVVEIPEKQFLRLKVRHHRKVAVSRLIDSHPGAPLPYLRLFATLQGLRSRQKGKVQEAPRAESVEDPPA